jgi:hypothetical protein
MENMETMNAVPPGAAAQSLVGSVDYMSFMDRHAYAVSNNPRSMDASVTPPSTIHVFPNATLSPHMSPKSVTPANSNVYQASSVQPRAPLINSDMYIAASTAMETFQSDIDNVKEDVQELKTGMQTIQQMLQKLVTPTPTVKKQSALNHQAWHLQPAEPTRPPVYHETLKTRH